MSTYTDWSDIELADELEDLTETRTFLARESERLAGVFAERLRCTTKFYGDDRYRWPASSWFHVTEVEGDLKRLRKRIVEVGVLIGKYRNETARRTCNCIDKP